MLNPSKIKTIKSLKGSLHLLNVLSICISFLAVYQTWLSYISAKSFDNAYNFKSKNSMIWDHKIIFVTIVPNLISSFPSYQIKADEGPKTRF